ncbi:MAG: DUF481 domain-containing protein [Sulfurimonas sp.]|uniref:DUF481 domain-containing protein n=1 Tax=Sulfurimonas sp. TaxID=2022749 RepID=UPI00263336D8|nr:DUF481 domain-containing protein [Sulfurimonas sp.]MDD2651899.1 DUF481 domain-containing protein [Sulfurimonas sp.]MDD3451784.1 DUF481 domain-containing protein [Sulfurimonas sp.]
MKKIVALSLVAFSLMAEQYIQDVKAEIKETKQKIARLNANLKELESALPKEELTYKARAEAGYMLNSGNSDTEAFNIDAKLSGKWDLHTLEISMLWQYGEDNDVENTNRFLGELVYDYKLSQRLSLDYLMGYKDDKFSGFDYQFYTGPGAKYVTIKTDFQDLTLDGNLLYAKDKIFGSTDRTYAAYRVQGVYNMQLLENLKFHQTLNYRSEFSDIENYFAYSKTGLSTRLSDIFSAGVAYYIDYTNKPALTGKTSTDTKFTFNLIADY